MHDLTEYKGKSVVIEGLDAQAGQQLRHRVFVSAQNVTILQRRNAKFSTYSRVLFTMRLSDTRKKWSSLIRSAMDDTLMPSTVT
jgi:hypothetical protein